MFRVCTCLSVCTASHPPPELAVFWASFPGFRGPDSALSLPTAELAQEHLSELYQVGSWLWVGTAVEPERLCCWPDSSWVCKRAGRGQASHCWPKEKK